MLKIDLFVSNSTTSPNNARPEELILESKVVCHNHQIYLLISHYEPVFHAMNEYKFKVFIKTLIYDVLSIALEPACQMKLNSP